MNKEINKEDLKQDLNEEVKNVDSLNEKTEETQECTKENVEDLNQFKIKNLQEENEALKKEKFKLSDENTKLNNELSTLKDRLTSIAAEYDNFRKRTAKEKEGIYTDAVEDILKNMLPVLDNLQRAEEASGSIEDLKKGIEMTLRAMEDAFSKLSVEEIDCSGEFDPYLHNAVMHIEDSELGTNAIAEVFLKGYKRGEKVIRHSMVKVAN